MGGSSNRSRSLNIRLEWMRSESQKIKRRERRTSSPVGLSERLECVVAALDLMKNEAGCCNSFVGIVLFNWNDKNVNIVIFQ